MYVVHNIAKFAKNDKVPICGWCYLFTVADNELLRKLKQYLLGKMILCHI